MINPKTQKLAGTQLNNRKAQASQVEVAVIIPAYNEARQIAGLLGSLLEAPILSEIIVVDDGSTDETAAVAERAALLDTRIKVISLTANLGKGAAVFTGADYARAPILLLLDADLCGLTSQHIEAMVRPVLDSETDMTVGIFNRGRWLTDLGHRTTPWLSGQRCFRKDMLASVDKGAADGYGLETALTLTARLAGWDYREIRLKGAYHKTGALDRGLYRGMKNRLKMLRDIGRAMNTLGGWRVFRPKLRLEARLCLILILILIATSLAFDRSRASSQAPILSFPVLNVAEMERILIISPHPDDETIGAGGMIQVALKQGSDVRVVIVTNGDGQVFVPLTIERSITTGARDFVSYGEHRQVETLKALAELGLRPEQVHFLGYPDRGVMALWTGDWQKDCPVRAIFTRAVHTPYQNAYNPLARYCGSDLAADFQAIIAGFMPDTIILPHPNDDHADHRATTNFVRMALASLAAENKDYRPELYAYLVHYGRFPQPRGFNTNRPLLPPMALSGKANQWFRLDLSREEILIKRAALEYYPTQMRLLGNFLPSFARPNELFVALETVTARPIDYSALPLAESGIKELPSLSEPSNESLRHFLLSGADLVGWQITRLGDQLILTADTRGWLLPGLQYRIRVKTPDGQTFIYTQKNSRFSIFRRSFTARLDLAEMGDPGVISFSADILQGVTLDRTGWYFLKLEDWLP
jgi:LmbE family N-acetylglucosaminyl deacetylase/GT2 family glycosyltransferase